MVLKIYLSNISPLWPYKRQEDLLREHVEGYPKEVRVFRDNLDPRDRRAHRSASLSQRANLLRPTTRQNNTEVIVLPSLAAFAWSQGDMLASITAAAARGATVKVLDAGLEIGPTSGADVMGSAIQAFEDARKRQAEFEKGRRGGIASAKKREDRARAAAETIRVAWERRDERTEDLLARAGISLNTAKRYLGGRPIAQKARAAAEKRKLARKAKA